MIDFQLKARIDEEVAPDELGFRLEETRDAFIKAAERMAGAGMDDDTIVETLVELRTAMSEELA